MTKIIVHNSMQDGSYILTAPEGKQFDPLFHPAFTPAQMLALGVFEGRYLNDTGDEYPADWLGGAKLASVGTNVGVNALGVKSRSPLSMWQERGWINEQDPRGWFEWYCRYYRGRRTADDARQIKRWLNFVRHTTRVSNSGGGDPNILPVNRQALIQWSRDPFPDVMSTGTVLEKTLDRLKLRVHPKPKRIR